MPHLAPCRYCGAETEMRHVAEGVVQILNPDGSLHECHEADRAQAIGHIYWGQIEDACKPMTVEGVIETLEALYELHSEELGGIENELGALTAAIEIAKLVNAVKPQMFR